jgi:SOS-response transcriptional repressor LexA
MMLNESTMSSSLSIHSESRGASEGRGRERLTIAQAETLSCIKALQKENGIPPTLQEIADRLKISTNAVSDRIKWISRKGYCTHTRRTPRSIILIDRKENTQSKEGK